MRTASLLLLLLPGTLFAQDFRAMPPELQARWRCSLVKQAGWNDRGCDDRGWRRPTFAIPGRFPEWMEPEVQALFDFMWHPAGAQTGRPVYFRRSVSLPGEIVQAAIHICVDDRADLYVNGRGLGQASRPHENFTFDITEALVTGQNVLAVQAEDLQPPAYGLLVVPEITQAFPLQAADWQCRTGDGPWRRAVPDDNPPIKLEGLEPFACLTVPGGMKEFSRATFRRTLHLDGLPLEATAVILADDSYELRVNGTLVALEKRLEQSYMPRRVNFTRHLRCGENELTVTVTNDWGPGRMYCVPTVTATF